MNVVDLIIVIMLAVGFVSGLARGLVRTLFGLAALVLGVAAAAGSFGFVASTILTFVPGERAAGIIAFILVFLVVFFAIAFVGKLIAKALKLVALGWLDRLAGGLLGVVLSSIAAGVLLLLVVLGGFHKNPALAVSGLAPKVLGVTDAIVTFIPGSVREGFDKEYRSLRSEWEEARIRARTMLV
ncbi:CvpA family protein [bacterium]|nr:CvpA family protein [bacterium]